MPPKKAAKKLHELAAEVKVGHKITDIKKRSYIVGKQFATGGFGRIHICHEEGKSQELVMKLEPSDNGPLFTEVNVFQRILRPEQLEAYKKKNKMSWIGLPYIISSGIFTYNSDKMRYMIIPKYATSLENIRESSNGKLALKQVSEVSLSTLNALDYVHEMDYTHADVKAANILLEKAENFSTAVLVDFGLARLSAKNEDKPDKKRAHNGTCIFTSIDAHRGCHPSFRGDIEILAYNVIYWLTGTLPWAAFESSPEKVFDEKKKFIAGLPGSLKSVLKDHSAAFDFVALLFDVSQKTKYDAKFDNSKLVQLATKLISNSKSSKSAKSNTSTSAKKAKEDVVQTESDSDEEVIEEKEEIKRKPLKVGKEQKTPPVPKSGSSIVSTRSSLRAAVSSRKAPRRVVSDSTSENDSAPTPKRVSPRDLKSVSTRRTPAAAVNVAIAEKIGNKYKRLSMGKPVLQEVAAESSKTGRLSGGTDAEASSSSLKTPSVAGTTRTRSGISSATKASPTKLRNIPGIRNFPKGRRSIMIRETAAKYSSRRNVRDNATPTFAADDTEEH